MKTTHIENQDGSLTITINLDSDDILALKHNLPGVKGIVDWFAKGPSSEKVALCRKRMCKEFKETALMNLAENGMTDRLRECMNSDKELVKEIVSLSSYKDRETIDAEAKLTESGNA